MSIERRIKYFLKNYEYDEKGIIKEIGSQFNLTDEVTLAKIRETRDKYPYLKKARNILKKFENIPRSKPSGVEVDIQGKSKENYNFDIRSLLLKLKLEISDNYFVFFKKTLTLSHNIRKNKEYRVTY